MVNKRIHMRKIRQALRLHFESNMSRRTIARSLRLSRDAVTTYLTRAAAAQLPWPLPDGMDDAALEQRLFPVKDGAAPRTLKPQPDWAIVHNELKRKGGTLLVLHEEYLVEHPDGMSYSMFCERYRVFMKTLRRYMRQTYIVGERVFVDYAGPTVPVNSRQTNDVCNAQIFVAVLGASNYIYAEAHRSQSLADWISAHVRMLEHFGAAPAVVVCDNLKSGVTHASRTEPVVNATYQAFADHYGMLVLPARARKPKDKAKVENSVLIAERWILFRLRNRVFTSLGELNGEIRELLVSINAKPFQKLPGSRQTAFETLDRPAMKPLPITPYEYAEFRRFRVGLDYRINIDGRQFSVPFRLAREEVDVRITANTLEVLYRGRRVASHVLTPGTAPVVDPQHLEPAHRAFGLWRIDQALEWATRTGDNVNLFMEKLFAGFRIREQGYRAHLALKRLAHEFGNERLDAACHRAIEIEAHSLQSIRSILHSRLDQVPSASSQGDLQEANFEHPNVRGATYYR
jgi:transposase